MSIMFPFGALGAAMELLINPAMVEATRKSLDDVDKALNKDNFRHNAQIGELSFGDAPTGTELSHHHSLAQQIVADTLSGINEDVAAFVTNVTKSAEVLVDVDGLSAEDLKKRTAVLEQFGYLERHSHGESNNQETRNDLQNGGN